MDALHRFCLGTSHQIKKVLSLRIELAHDDDHRTVAGSSAHKPQRIDQLDTIDTFHALNESIRHIRRMTAAHIGHCRANKKVADDRALIPTLHIPNVIEDGAGHADSHRHGDQHDSDRHCRTPRVPQNLTAGQSGFRGEPNHQRRSGQHRQRVQARGKQQDHSQDDQHDAWRAELHVDDFQRCDRLDENTHDDQDDPALEPFPVGSVFIAFCYDLHRIRGRCEGSHHRGDTGPEDGYQDAAHHRQDHGQHIEWGLGDIDL